MKTTVYVSGKISGVPGLNAAKFNAISNRLRFILGPNDEVINPHELPAFHDGSWASYMRVCLRALTRASSVVVLNDWKDSRGAIIEVLIASMLGMPITTLYDMDIIPVRITSRLKAVLVFKLFLNRFAHASDYQPK